MGKEQSIDMNSENNAMRPGSIHAAHESVVPAAQRKYIESLTANGMDVYIDTHGNMAIREAYAIPKTQIPDSKLGKPIHEGEIIDISSAS